MLCRPRAEKRKRGTKTKAIRKTVAVTYKDKNVTGRLGDTMPSESKWLDDASIDPTTGFVKALG